MAAATALTVLKQQKKQWKWRLARLLLRGVVFFFLGLAAAGASWDGQAFGAGAAFVGAAGPGFAGAASVIGACLGYLLFYGLPGSVQYMAASIMIYTVAFVFQYLSVSRKAAFMPLVVMLLVGLTSAFGTVSTVRYEIAFMMDVAKGIVLNGALTYTYAKAIRCPFEAVDITSGELFARLILCGTICNSLSEVGFGGYGVAGNALIVCFVLLAAYENDLSVALSCACVVSICGGGNVIVNGVAVWCVKQLSIQLRSLFGIVFMAVAILLMEFDSAWATQAATVYELSAGVLLFIMFGGYGRYFCAEAGGGAFDAGESFHRQRQLSQLQNTVSALEAVSEHFREIEDDPWDIEIQPLLDRAMDSVCEGCGRRNSCRTSKRVDMLQLFMSADEAVAGRGRMLESDLPDMFRERCYAYKSLVLAVNHELRHQTEEQLRLHNGREAAALAAEQYAVFGRLLRELSHELEGGAVRTVQAERTVERYFRQHKLSCYVHGYFGGAKRLVLEITGNDVERLISRHGYLEELSRLLKTRLCVPEATKHRLLLYEAEPLAVNVGIATRRKHGERVSGDQVKQFKTDAGKLYIILSDGIGTGSYAQEQSSQVIECLELLLNGGVQPVSALEILNGLTYFRNKEDWGYATVDLLELNLFTGQADFYKLGAADSYVFDGKAVRTISGISLPVGMEVDNRGSIDHATMHLKPGATGIMVTDGVELSQRELEQLLGEERYNMKVLSRMILLSDDRGMVGEDDMTVVAFSVELRK